MSDEYCWTYIRYTRLYTQAINAISIDPKEVLQWRWSRFGHVLECPICQNFRAEMAELIKQIDWRNENDN